MQNVLGWYVYNSANGTWLCDDENSWSDQFHAATSFTSFELANDIMEREGGDYVFACMGSV